VLAFTIDQYVKLSINFVCAAVEIQIQIKIKVKRRWSWSQSRTNYL